MSGALTSSTKPEIQSSGKTNARIDSGTSATTGHVRQIARVIGLERFDPVDGRDRQLSAVPALDIRRAERLEVTDKVAAHILLDENRRAHRDLLGSARHSEAEHENDRQWPQPGEDLCERGVLQHDGVHRMRQAPRLRDQQKSTQHAERDRERDGAAREPRSAAQPVFGAFPVHDGTLRE